MTIDRWLQIAFGCASAPLDSVAGSSCVRQCSMVRDTVRLLTTYMQYRAEPRGKPRRRCFIPAEISFKVAAQVKSTLWTALFLLSANIGNAETTTMPLTFDIKAAEWFANLALACGAQGIPESHQSHVEQRCGCAASAKTDSRFLRVLRLAFLGARTLAPHSLGQDVSGRAVCSGVSREALRQSLTADNIAQEAAYLRGEGRASFERPYGLAWLLQLVAELREW